MKKLFLIVLALLFAVQLFAQNITATGTVKNADGLVLVGVSVTEKGLTNSTLTDIDGNFQLLLTSGKPIVISMKGYETQVVEVGPDGKVPDIILKKAAKKISLELFTSVNYGQSIIGNDRSEYNKIKSSLGYGYTGGILLCIKQKNTKRDIKKGRNNKYYTEIGLQFCSKNLKFPDYNLNTEITRLAVPIISTWKSGIDKGFLITVGGAPHYLLKGDVIQLDGKEFKFYKCGIDYSLGFGYEFASGFGMRLAGYGGISIPTDKTEELFYCFEWFGEFAVTYRF